MLVAEVFSDDWSPDALGNINGTTNAANEITATGYVYDHNGNLTADGTHAYTYDAWDRLVSVTEGATTVGYRYDGQSRRTERIVGTSVERYYYAGQQVVQVDAFSGGVLQGSEQYVWSARYIDTPVLRDSFDGNGERIAAGRIYYLTDANHNVTSLVDASGAVVERYYSSPYGQVTILTPDWTQVRASSFYGNTILFAGMDYDPSTSLYYDRARWYNPSTGTFLTRDPAAADVNLYRYCHNDPISSTDPTGLDESLSRAATDGNSKLAQLLDHYATVASQLSEARAETYSQQDSGKPTTIVTDQAPIKLPPTFFKLSGGLATGPISPEGLAAARGKPPKENNVPSPGNPLAGLSPEERSLLRVYTTRLAWSKLSADERVGALIAESLRLAKGNVAIALGIVSDLRNKGAIAGDNDDWACADHYLNSLVAKEVYGVPALGSTFITLGYHVLKFWGISVGRDNLNIPPSPPTWQQLIWGIAGAW